MVPWTMQLAWWLQWDKKLGGLLEWEEKVDGGLGESTSSWCCVYLPINIPSNILLKFAILHYFALAWRRHEYKRQHLEEARAEPDKKVIIGWDNTPIIFLFLFSLSSSSFHSTSFCTRLLITWAQIRRRPTNRCRSRFALPFSPLILLLLP